MLYNKSYTAEEEVTAKINYCNNVKQILEIREKNSNIEVGLNSYADMPNMRKQLQAPTKRIPNQKLSDEPDI